MGIRRFFQFRLRTLLLIMTVIAVWLPLGMKLGDAIGAARERARHNRCLNKTTVSCGAVFNRAPTNGSPMDTSDTRAQLQGAARIESDSAMPPKK
jgi:hypothetical protein